MADEVIITVRVPELPSASDDLSPDDLMIVWQAASNKTVQKKLSEIHDYIASGGGAGAVPANSVLGSTFLHVVTAGEAGSTTVSIPGLAGQQFTLSRDGFPLELGDDVTPLEYAILAAGGFKITIPGDVLVLGQRFFGQVYTLLGNTVTTTTSGGGLLGKVLVVTNLPMGANHLNRLLQIRAGNNPLIVTLPDVDDIPVGTVIPFEAAITNTCQSTIKTRGGQNIYFNNTSSTEVYIGPGESMKLFRDDDGFYMMTKYPDTGKINGVYKVGIDELLCDGSYISQSHYPRLYAWAQTLGASWVSDTLRNTASITLGSGASARVVLKPYRGCFGQGTGPDQFQLPDLMNVSIRGLKNDGGADSERYYNHAGGFQLNEIGPHVHPIAYKYNGSDGTQNQAVLPKTNNSESQSSGGNDITTDSYGGAETRMDNVGLLMAVKC